MWKRIRDCRISTKLCLYLALSVLLIGTAIGSAGYFQMRSELLSSAEDTVISFLKHAGTRLDEQMKALQMSAYSFSIDNGIQAVVEDAGEKSKWEQTLERNSVITSVSQYGTLYQYSDFIIIQKKNGDLVLDGEIPGDPEAFVREGRDLLKGSRVVTWGKIQGKNCLVRKIIHSGNGSRWEENGFLVAGVKNSMFQVGEESSAYTKDDNLIVAGADGTVYKDAGVLPEGWQLQDYFDYKGGSYSVYAVRAKYQEKSYLIVPLKTMDMGMNLVCVVPYHMILEKAAEVLRFIALITAALCVLGLCAARIFYAGMKKNLVILEQGMHAYEEGNFSRLSSPVCYDELGLLILQFNHMGMEIKRLNALSQREEEEKQALQYQVLETQINPHFLYNTLGTIKWMAYEKEEEEIARLAGAIINLLRFTVKNVNKMIPLKEEIAYVRDYVTIQKIRYEDAFRVEYDIAEEAETFRITCFILQPFVENSILHGMDISKNTGRIGITASVEGEVLILSVADNGTGMDPQTLKELKDKIDKGRLEEYRGFNGVGVTNIILRMKMTYGEDFSYEFLSRDGEGTTITLRIPKGE